MICQSESEVTREFFLPTLQYGKQRRLRMERHADPVSILFANDNPGVPGGTRRSELGI